MFGTCAYSKRQRLCGDSSDDGSDESYDDPIDDSSNDSSVVEVSSGSSGNMVSDDIRKNLLKVLRQIHTKTSSEFAVGKVSTDLTTTPGIKITNYGPLSLPVTEATIGDLRKHFHQAPYGLGEATIIDKNVRDSYQLDPEKFEISNARFHLGVQKLVQQVKLELGCSNNNVTSKLYKLLLYEPGGHFKPHRDTEKHPGMFATLIIQLPSIFTGGDLIVKHNSKEKKIAFGDKESEFLCIYAAHYADCEHELTEITSGYRMALVYSLCWDGNGVQPSPPDIPTNELAGLLQNLDQLPNPMIAWGLDHHYSKASLLDIGAQTLKGGDKLIYSSLEGANALLEEDKKLDIFIVEAKRTDNMYGTCTMEYYGGGRRGYWAHKNEDCFDNDGDCETEYEYNVIDDDGKLWSSSLDEFKLDVKEDVLNVGKDDDKFWGKCREGECSGPSGNEGASKTNWYRRYVLVAFPKETAVKVVYKHSISSAIKYLKQELHNKGADHVKKLASDIVDLCIQKKKKFCKSKEDVMAALRMLLAMNDLELVKKLLALLSEQFLTTTHSGYYRQTGYTITQQAFGIPSEKMLCLLKDLISTFGWKALEDVLTKLIESCPSQHCKHAIAFLEQYPKDVPTEKLLASIVHKALNSTEAQEAKLSDENVLAIGQAIFNHPDATAQLIMPFLDLPKLQNLQMLNNILLFWGKTKSENMEKSTFYQMTFAKFGEKIHSVFQGGHSLSVQEMDAIVKGAEYLVNIQDNGLFKKLVDDVLLTLNAALLKKLLESSFAQVANVSEPVKYLIQARANQLLPIVRVGEPKFNWCLPHAVVPDYPDIQAFLQGPERTLVYNKFNARTRADSFKRQFLIRNRDASVEVTGKLRETVVKITKSQHLKTKHDEAMQKYKTNCEELRRLQAKLGTAAIVL